MFSSDRNKGVLGHPATESTRETGTIGLIDQELVLETEAVLEMELVSGAGLTAVALVVVAGA